MNAKRKVNSLLSTITLLAAICFLPLVSQATECRGYKVAFGAVGVEGRVYNLSKDTTTFTYTVHGTSSDCGSLKYFQLENPCFGDAVVSEITPSFDTITWTDGPSNMKQPMPAFSSYPYDFGYTGIQWFGWHSANTAPSLVLDSQTRVFSFTIDGDIPEGTVRYALRHHLGQRTYAGAADYELDGSWVNESGKITGPTLACNSTCLNRKTISFNDNSAGSLDIDAYLSEGVTGIYASRNPIGADAGGFVPNAWIFDSSAPTGGDSDLGTPNSGFGGPGFPGLNFSTQAGLGNHSALGKILIIPENATTPDDAALGGQIYFAFSEPTKVCSLKLVDIDSENVHVTGYTGNTEVFTQTVSPVGHNSAQTLSVCEHNDYELTVLKVDFDGVSGAMDDLSICTLPNICGDDNLGGTEQCDDGNTINGDGCNASCRVERCGDGIDNNGSAEQCDDGNTSNGDGCNASCQVEYCGDGIDNNGSAEQCDDGNTTDGDGCNASCQVEYCGDGVDNNGSTEQCDDGNTDNGDGCSSTCQSEVCGDGNLHTEFGESCDDGNLTDGDGCSSTCQPEVCGDGVIQRDLGEQCDDGNTDGGDGCNARCVVEFCGDGIVNDSDEQCDDGNTVDGDGCSSTCEEDPIAPPTGCEDYDITMTQFTIDAGVKRQEFLIKKTLGALKRLDASASTAKYIAKTRAAAREAQLEGWRVAWSIPSIGTACNLQETVCGTSNINAEAMAVYIERTNTLNKLFKKSFRKLKKSRSGGLTTADKRLRKKQAKFFKTNVELANEVPGVVPNCIFPNGN